MTVLITTNDHIQILATTKDQNVLADIVCDGSISQSIKIAIQAVLFTAAGEQIVALLHFQFDKSLKKG